VEGHELEVLQGAEETVRRNRPALIVEIEERHHPGRSWEIIDYVKRWGYEVRYFKDGNLMPAESIDFAAMQKPERLKPAKGLAQRDYINNFVFVPLPDIAPSFGGRPM
jgi:hypothetical protein